jgi:regulator of protease activity HflC (stomatin/prohibitin superfamily)
VGVLFEDGRYVETLPPGKYAFWKNTAKVMLVPVDLRETMLDIGGQKIMTADKVTLRLNAVASYRVADAHKALSAADDAQQALYREAQLALRAVAGARELDQFLADKDAVAKDLEGIVRRRVAALGLEILSVGIRDVILPGDMMDLMNKVTEAKKAAEANLIVRREETAASRGALRSVPAEEGPRAEGPRHHANNLRRLPSRGRLRTALAGRAVRCLRNRRIRPLGTPSWSRCIKRRIGGYNCSK